MQQRRKIVAVTALIALTGSVIAWRSAKGGRDPRAIVVSGTVESIEADLGFQLAGRLASVSVREGDVVTPGAVLAVLDQAELTAQREAAAAQVGGAKALLAEYVAGSRLEEIARARAQLAVAADRRDAAKRDRDRLADLVARAVISRQDFDHQQTALDVSEGELAKAQEELRLLLAGTRPERVEQQRAALSQAAASLGRIDALLQQSVVLAPFAGTVTVRHREPGEAVAPGDAVLTVQDLSDRWVRVYVPGDEVGRLHLGQCASISADAWADRHYAGRVRYIASVAEFTPRNVQATKDRVRLVYEVRVRITGDSAIDLKPGLPADVAFASDSTSCGGEDR